MDFDEGDEIVLTIMEHHSNWERELTVGASEDDDIKAYPTVQWSKLCAYGSTKADPSDPANF
jgi:hypothetical protein